jgi:hypothetical protein
MKNKIIPIVIAVFVVLVLALGAVQILKGDWMAQKAGKAEKEINNLFQSGLVTNWSAIVQGQILSISERTLVLYSNEEQISLDIKNSAQIGYLSLDQKTGKTTYQEFEFEDVKAGDKVNIVARLEGSSLIGESVTVLPGE